MKTGRCYLSYRFLCNVKRRNVYEEHEQLKDQTYNQKEIDFEIDKHRILLIISKRYFNK